MARTFFTSDIHFGHKAVLDFDGRPWETVEEMNQGLIERWNKKVGRGDTIYVLGDLCWLSGNKALELVSQLNGQIHLIRGNHDRIKKACYRDYFSSIKDYEDKTFKLENGEKVRVVMSHYPIPLYHGHYHKAVHLYGHVHNTSEEDITKEMIELLREKNIACDMFNVWCGFYDWAPATLDEIFEFNHFTYRKG